MTLAQHPATEVLSAILSSDLCRIICEFAAPHAAPVIKTQYRLIRTEQKEELGIFAPIQRSAFGRSWQVTPVQHIVEFSPNCDVNEHSDYTTDSGTYNPIRSSHEIRVSSNWTRERDRRGLGRKNTCLCGRVEFSSRPRTCTWAPSVCRNTYGPISLRHIQRFRTRLCSMPNNIWQLEECEEQGAGLSCIRRYQKWIWSIRDQKRWIDESCELNFQLPASHYRPLDAQDKVKSLMML